ncbi:MAG: energy transducer TonB [Smithella sp.]
MTFPMFNNGYSHKDPNFYNMLLLSLVVHFIAITIVLFSVSSAPRHLTFGPVYSVSLVGPEGVSSKSQGSSPLVKEIEQSEIAGDSANSFIYKKQISRSATAPIKKEETDRVSIEKAISAIKKKELAAQGMSSSSSRTNSGDRTGRMAAGGGASGGAASGGMGGRTSDYAGFVSSRVHSNWSIPLELKPRGNIVTIIEIKIRRDGSLAYAGFEKRSGNSIYDDSAMKAVKKSAPFPPLPAGYPSSTMEIGIRFHPSQLH